MYLLTRHSSCRLCAWHSICVWCGEVIVFLLIEVWSITGMLSSFSCLVEDAELPYYHFSI